MGLRSMSMPLPCRVAGVNNSKANRVWLGILWFCFYFWCVFSAALVAYVIYFYQSWSRGLYAVVFSAGSLLSIFQAIQRRRNRLG
jgi:hypothetical protein